MSVQQELQTILKDTLQMEDALTWDASTEILGVIPEFDSMAVVTVLTQVEEFYGISIEDDEISAEVFETFGALLSFVEGKLDE